MMVEMLFFAARLSFLNVFAQGRGDSLDSSKTVKPVLPEFHSSCKRYMDYENAPGLACELLSGRVG
jgi:hypothetical protein